MTASPRPGPARYASHDLRNCFLDRCCPKRRGTLGLWEAASGKSPECAHHMLKVSCSRQGAAEDRKQTLGFSPACPKFYLQIMTTQTTSLPVTCLTLNCVVSPRRPNQLSELREIFHRSSVSLSKGKAADRKHAQYFTPFYNRNRNVYFTASCRADKYNNTFFISSVFNQEENEI